MEPPFQISSHILRHVSEIERLIGRLEGFDQPTPQPHLRKSNRIRTVQGSLAIEGNTLNLDQVTALIEGKPVVGDRSEIQEVKNAIKAYDRMHRFKPDSVQSLLDTHRIMMSRLIPSAGKWRSGSVGILRGTEVSHLAPPADKVPYLMGTLFEFLKTNDHHELIKSAVFHYELEFIHPFEDGSGRIGRFWHSLLLTQYHPVFEFTPVESLIKANQGEYYKALETADRSGESTAFIEFSLDMVRQALADLIGAIRPGRTTPQGRLERAHAHFQGAQFSRKDYLNLHKMISTATASRDLKSGVTAGILTKQGLQALTVYRFLNPTSLRAF